MYLRRALTYLGALTRVGRTLTYLRVNAPPPLVNAQTLVNEPPCTLTRLGALTSGAAR